jgi:hypothetical protein
MYEIRQMDTLTRETHRPSHLVYRLSGTGKGFQVWEFVALFSNEEDATWYAATMTAVDAGLERQRVIDDLAGVIRNKRVEIELQLEEEDEGSTE